MEFVGRKTETLAVNGAVVAVHLQFVGGDFFFTDFFDFRQAQLVATDVAPDGEVARCLLVAVIGAVEGSRTHPNIATAMRTFADDGLHVDGTVVGQFQLDMVMNEVMKAAGNDLAVFVKMNMRDGFKGGMELEESLQVAKRLEESGAHALVLSGGFVSRAPMYVMRGEMPIRSMSHYMKCWWLKYGVRLVGKWMIPAVPFQEAYFLEDALKFRKALHMPLVYVGGLVSRQKIDEVLNDGFEAVQMARALLNEPDFINRMRKEEDARSACKHSNYCIARMYSIDMACHQHLSKKLPPCLQREIERIEAQSEKRQIE